MRELWRLMMMTTVRVVCWWWCRWWHSKFGWWLSLSSLVRWYHHRCLGAPPHAWSGAPSFVEETAAITSWRWSDPPISNRTVVLVVVLVVVVVVDDARPFVVPFPPERSNSPRNESDDHDYCYYYFGEWGFAPWRMVVHWRLMMTTTTCPQQFGNRE